MNSDMNNMNMNSEMFIKALRLDFLYMQLKEN